MKCRDSDTAEITLSGLVSRHTRDYLDSSEEPKEAFIKRVILPTLVKHGFFIEPVDGFQKWENSKCRNLVRYIYESEDQKLTEFKANWIFPWLSSLPEPYKSNAMMELCGMFGSYYAPMTTMGRDCEQLNDGAVVATLSDVTKEFGAVLQHSEPVIDGRYDSNDRPEKVQMYVDKIHCLIGKSIVELGKVYQGTGIEPAAYRAMSHSSFFKK